jgi:Cdc6-like AAA superfamily ATPase
MTCSNPRFTPGETLLGIPTHWQKTIPRLSTMFTGRNDILQQLELAQYLNPSISSISLKRQRIFVLYGLGGTGKTQIMAKFVDEFGDRCDRPQSAPNRLF